MTNIEAVKDMYENKPVKSDRVIKAEAAMNDGTFTLEDNDIILEWMRSVNKWATEMADLTY